MVGGRVSADEVELQVNCHEGTYRRVLTGGFFGEIARQNRRAFARAVVLVNNVRDRGDAAARADRLRHSGEVDAVYWVEEERDAALALAGLTLSALGRVPHYSDFAHVGVMVARARWLLLWDAEVALAAPADWIAPAIALMESESRILVANPRWEDASFEREYREMRGGFALGFGFSDQVFLARPSELAAPIYGEHCPASRRYPTAHIAPTFEQRIDAYMRTHDRWRASFAGATYRHPYRGAAAYAPVNLRERLRRARNRLALRALERSRSSDPRRRLYWH